MKISDINFDDITIGYLKDIADYFYIEHSAAYLSSPEKLEIKFVVTWDNLDKLFEDAKRDA